MMTMKWSKLVVIVVAWMVLSLSLPAEAFLRSSSIASTKRFTARLPLYASTTAVSDTTKPSGSVCLIGAGPGDPDLLTMQAWKRLQAATLVVSDRLVSKEILDLIQCPVKVANKQPGCADEAQDELNQWVIDAALRGEQVVRLKIGDPFLFGRGGEEILEYRKHQIDVEVLPGLSSSYTAPLAAMIPLTHRGTSSQVLISTGYGMQGTHVDLPHYHAERTVVLLMAVGRIGEICKTLQEVKGYPGAVPLCIVEKATTPQQRVLYATVATAAEVAERQQAKAPATIIIGDVVHVLTPPPQV